VTNIGEIVALCVLLGASAGVGCGSGHACEVPFNSSLDRPGPTHVCIEYSSLSDEMACEKAGGTGVSGCPSEDVIGTCEIDAADGSATAFFYDGRVDVAKARCAFARGVWTDG
jgi:hypothetical protein